MNTLNTIGHAVFCAMLFRASVSASFSCKGQGKIDDKIWQGEFSNEVFMLAERELDNGECAKLVRQYGGASNSIKSSEEMQWLRSASQCAYDVPGGLRFVRQIMKRSPRKSQYFTSACCWLVISSGKFPRDGKIARQICDEYVKVTRFPSQAVKLRASVEYNCGKHRLAFDLMKKAKRLWDSESHANLDENSPINAWWWPDGKGVLGGHG